MSFDSEPSYHDTAEKNQDNWMDEMNYPCYRLPHAALSTSGEDLQARSWRHASDTVGPCKAVNLLSCNCAVPLL